MFSASSEKRFWSKVAIGDDADCWPWLGHINSNGYGRIRLDGLRTGAHRIAWMIANGRPFPSGMSACHSCDNPVCVNPAHIWPGTHIENMQDAVDKRQAARPTRGDAPTCIRCGHIRLDDFIERNGTRKCRNCNRSRTRERMRQRKSAPVPSTARPLTLEERQAIGEAHFETSVFNVPGRTPEVQTGYSKHFGRQFAELTRPFGGR